VAQEPAIAEMLSKEDLGECFDYERHLKRVEAAYGRVGL